ncbi:unnamed protein product [Nippostrongylus brasiliensis]|uniref:Tox-REase-7 domain-containing protein n=1 Tax=Nippostrongylus brasiliensis TaxID=27835 RepID=A0A0N4YT58_NIPBR|nr:unnamed protein product [Nippostrongylus brasiliensis]
MGTFGFGGCLLGFLRSLHTTRAQGFKVNNSRSRIYHALSGVAQVGLGKNNNEFNFTSNGKPITRSSKIRDLGVAYNAKLEYDDYAKAMVLNATAQSNYILRVFMSSDIRLLFKLFTTYVRPQVEYFSQLCSPYKFLADMIEQVQRSSPYGCFRRKGVVGLSYEERLKLLDGNALELKHQLICYSCKS